MIALFFLAVLIFYIIVAIFCTIFVARTFHDVPKTKAILVIVTALIFLLIPIWDVVPGQLYFHHLCETEGGLKIYKTVEGVDGFYYFPGAGFSQEALQQYGYEFIEAGSNGAFVRYSMSNSGVVKEKSEKLKSHFGIEHKARPRSWHVRENMERIIRLGDNELLATKVRFEYAGSWIQRKVAPLLGGGDSCPLLPPSSPTNKEFYVKTLKPRKTEE